MHVSSAVSFGCSSFVFEVILFREGHLKVRDRSLIQLYIFITGKGATIASFVTLPQEEGPSSYGETTQISRALSRLCSAYVKWNAFETEGKEAVYVQHLHVISVYDKLMTG